jgi:hypothetical protein
VLEALSLLQELDWHPLLALSLRRRFERALLETGGTSRASRGGESRSLHGLAAPERQALCGEPCRPSNPPPATRSLALVVFTIVAANRRNSSSNSRSVISAARSWRSACCSIRKSELREGSRRLAIVTVARPYSLLRGCSRWHGRRRRGRLAANSYRIGNESKQAEDAARVYAPRTFAEATRRALLPRRLPRRLGARGPPLAASLPAGQPADAYRQ